MRRLDDVLWQTLQMLEIIFCEEPLTLTLSVIVPDITLPPASMQSSQRERG